MAGINSIMRFQPQQADPVGAIARGFQVGQQMRAGERQNALADFTQQNGAAIMAGDQNALAQYAQFDPAGAAQFQDRASAQTSAAQEKQAAEAERLARMVAASSDKPRAYREALAAAQQLGMDVSQLPPSWEEGGNGIVAYLTLSREEKSEVERLIKALPEGEERNAAIRTHLKIAPDANTVAKEAGQMARHETPSGGQVLAEGGRMTRHADTHGLNQQKFEHTVTTDARDYDRGVFESDRTFDAGRADEQFDRMHSDRTYGAERQDAAATQAHRAAQLAQGDERQALAREKYENPRDKNGITIAPDGTVQIGGTPGLQRGTSRDLEDRMVSSGTLLSGLSQIEASFKPEYLELGTKIREGIARGADYIGQASPEQKELIGEFQTFQRRTLDNLTSRLNELSGAAVTPQEYERIKGTMPAMEDSPTQFQAKMLDAIKMQKMALARYNYVLNSGDLAGRKPWEVVSLSDMPKVINDRGAEIEQQMQGQDPAEIRQAVRVQLAREFGI